MCILTVLVFLLMFFVHVLVIAVSHSQITRLYSRFTSLDKGENGTLRYSPFPVLKPGAVSAQGTRWYFLIHC